jgi:hypothetical protein
MIEPRVGEGYLGVAANEEDHWALRRSRILYDSLPVPQFKMSLEDTKRELSAVIARAEPQCKHSRIGEEPPKNSISPAIGILAQELGLHQERKPT